MPKESGEASPSTSGLRRKAETAWTRWARGAMALKAAAARTAASAALEALGWGADATTAAMAARQRAGHFGESERTDLGWHLARLQALHADLAAEQPEGALTPDGLRLLSTRVEARIAVVQAVLAGRFVPGAAPEPEAVPAAPPAEAALEPAPAGPSMREFFADRGVLLVSYTGAFLLIVATILFETYGWSGLPGAARFAGVLALALVFASAGWACYRSERLRIVGETYIAIFALISPLVFVAAYVFLELGRDGISVDLALASTGLSCSALYAVLALRLRSRGYAALSLLALPAGLVGVVNLLELGSWRGAALAPLVGFYAYIAHRNRPREGEVFGAWTEIFVHGAAIGAVVATLTVAGGEPGPVLNRSLAVTFAIVAAGYTVQHRLLPGRDYPAHLAMAGLALAGLFTAAALELGAWGGPAVAVMAALYLLAGPGADRLQGSSTRLLVAAGRLGHPLAAIAAIWSFVYPWNPFVEALPASWHLVLSLALLTGVYVALTDLGRTQLRWVPGLGLSLTVLSAVAASRADVTWYALALVILSSAYVAASLRMEGGSRVFYEWGAAVQLLALYFVHAQLAWLQAFLLLEGSSAIAVLAIRRRQPAWLLVTGAGLAAGWYWLATAVLPTPAHPAGTDLLGVYSPLPALFALVAMALRWRVPQRWALPLYATAGVIAAFVVGGAAAYQDLGLVGVSLLTYAVLIYAGAVVERQAWAVAAAACGAAAALLALLANAAAPSWLYPLVVAGLAWMLYLAGMAWAELSAEPAPRWQDFHRFSGLALSGLTALSCLGVGEFWSGGPGALATVAVTLALGAMLGVESRLRSMPALEYWAALVASVAGVWLCRYLRFDNPQWHVLLPGATLVGAGLRLGQDTRFQGRRQLASGLAGLGAVLLLGTSAIQSLSEQPWLSTSLLVGEGVVAILGAVWARSRVLALSGAAAIAFSSLRAAFLVLQVVPAFAVFGILALLLLSVGAALAVAREPAGRMRGSVARSWQDWS